ncbi:winged helix DNA-binding domain-containing protein [Microbacterium sp.]|uniref:winged helix DNA-binding domain-containing protein n=1 Tax=Microbacterium sp. TaxID=51671 RepID=UPI0039E33CD9
MTPRALLSERLRSHRLSAPARSVTDAAAHMLAVQAQDFVAGRWALGIRSSGSPTLSGVDRAFARGDLVRSWTMRGTLHIIPAVDLRWVLSVTGPRQQAQSANRRRDLGIDEALLERVARELRVRLADGGRTRGELFEDLAALGIDPTGQRGVHILAELCIEGVLVQGPVVARDGAVAREQLFVLADAHITADARPDDPLAELFVRYIDGHGPAGVADFAWWSGLTLTAARDAVERSRHRVSEVEEGLFVAASRPRRARGADDGCLLALPMFDEFYISYADRSTVADTEAMRRIGPGKNGMVRASLVGGGRIVGAWTHSAAVGRHRDAPAAEPFVDLAPEAVAVALQRYSDFVTG